MRRIRILARVITITISIVMVILIAWAVLIQLSAMVITPRIIELEPPRRTIDPPLTDQQNMFVALAGLSAPASRDFIAFGSERLALLNVFRDANPNHYGPPLDDEFDTLRVTGDIPEACGTPGHGCFTWAKQNPAETEHLLRENALLLHRLRTTLSLPDYHNNLVLRTDRIHLSPGPIFSAIRLYRLQLAAAQMRAPSEAILDEFHYLLRGSRIFLARSETLLSKIIATAMHASLLQVYDDLLSQGLNLDTRHIQDLTQEERSMRRVFASELEFTQLLTTLTTAERKDTGIEITLGDRIAGWYINPQLTVQHASVIYQQIVERSELDDAALRDALTQPATPSRCPLRQLIFNPGGCYLLMVGSDAVSPYLTEVRRLDAHHRLLRAKTEILRHSIPHEAMPQFIASQGLRFRAPLSVTPLYWNAATDSIALDTSTATDSSTGVVRLVLYDTDRATTH